MKNLVFLPDRTGRDEMGQQSGFVRVGADGSALSALSQRLVLPPREMKQASPEMWRGVLALALLCDAWPDSGVKPNVLTVEADSSLFASWVLSARPAEEANKPLHLALLEKDGQKRLLGILDAHAGLVLPATATDFTGFVPARAAWYDAENDLWHDPVPYLNENERAILLARLTMMGLDSEELAAFKADIADAEKAAALAVQAGDEEALHALGLRIQAVCALSDFADFAVRREPCAVTEDNPIVRLHSVVDVRYAAQRECATYLWKGVAFARTSAALGLTGTNDPAQETALADIDEELRLLGENSTRWSSRCANGITDWLMEQDAALLPETKAQAELIRHVQMVKAREIQQTVTLQWPWNAASGAVQYLLREALGEGWMEGAKKPFADYLTRLENHVLTDAALQHCCAFEGGVYLPPLSKEMAACVARSKDGSGLAADMMRFEPQEDGGVVASFLLRGNGEMRLARTYGPEEIMHLAAEESPCAAVWPSLAMDAWHAYHVFLKGGGVSLAALCGREWKTVSPSEEGWQCLRVEDYPACLCVMKDDQCLGVLPNAQPIRKIDAAGDAQVAIDMGASATAVVITVNGKRIPAEGADLTKLLVVPTDMPADDFLASLMAKELTPSAVLLTGNGDELFTDGYVYNVTRLDALSALEPGSVCTQMKWRADDRSVRARRILLHQVMLTASLTAVLAGARSIRWRVTVADEMADDGRYALLNMIDEMSILVAQETGLMLQDGKFTVTWAEEAAALHAYLRSDGGMKGTFATLDLGGSSVKTHLWMQGKLRPLGGAVMLEGTSTALLTTLREHPEWLWEDFADCGDEAFLDDVRAVCEQLTLAGESAVQSDKAVMMLDALLAQHRQLITQHLYARFSAQRPTYLQGILLETYAAALFNVGLMLEQAGEDSTINHLFPPDLPVCLTGRGAWLLDTLTPQLRNGLQYVAHAPMQLRHPVRTLTVRAMPKPAMSVALGMSVLKDTQQTINTPFIRTRQSFSELMCLLMKQLMQCYPMHMWMLHPGVFDQWGQLTEEGNAAIRRSASAVYGEGEDIPASVMAFVGKLRRTAAVPEAAVYPGE
ncbi:MAG: hypothetical protein IJO39_00595 [Clostridia bacterium]|nr:hypothetical protein [Clostridia bacterium]